MLKIVYLICCGMDVHKSFLVACIATTNDQGINTYTSKRFSTFTGDLRRRASWLAEHNCIDLYGVHGDNTGFPSTTFWNHPAKSFLLISEIRQSNPRQERRLVDCGYLQAQSGLRELYSSRRYPSTSGFSSLSLESHKYYNR